MFTVLLKSQVQNSFTTVNSVYYIQNKCVMSCASLLSLCNCCFHNFHRITGQSSDALTQQNSCQLPLQVASCPGSLFHTQEHHSPYENQALGPILLLIFPQSSMFLHILINKKFFYIRPVKHMTH